MTIEDLLRLQQGLDEFILSNKKVDLTEKELLKSRLIALFTEVGEFCNEVQVFKYWKEKQDTNKDKELDEFVDILFFWLSIGNLKGYTGADISDAYLKKYKVNLKRASGGY